MTAPSSPWAPSTPPQAPSSTGGRPRLWLAPCRASGPQFREAASARLVPRQRVPLTICSALLGGVVGGLAVSGADAVLVLGVALVVVVGVQLVYRTLLVRKRLACGMVRVTPAQFDLAVAMGALPADRIDQGRQLHDRLVWLLQQPHQDPAAVGQVEQWMAQLAGSR